MPARNPWDRRDSETTQAFRAFRTYLELGPNRSTAKAAHALGKVPGYKRALDGWSSQHDWQDRVAAYEAHEARVRDEAAFSATTQRARARVMAEQAQLSQEALTQIPVAFLTKIKNDPDCLKDLPIETLARLVPLAARAIRGPVWSERLARDMSTENHGNADGSLIGAEWVEGKTDDEIEAFLQQQLGDGA